MRGRVGVMIGLDLDNDPAGATEQECRTDQIGRDLVDAAVEEAFAEARRLGHGEGGVYTNHTMRIFLAGAAGVIGRRLTPLLVLMGHEVTGTTRSAAKAGVIEASCGRPVVVDVFDAAALTKAVLEARPEVVIHQLTDLPDVNAAQVSAAGEANARLRIEGTRNLMAAAKVAGARRVIAQSIAFAYAPGPRAAP